MAPRVRTVPARISVDFRVAEPPAAAFEILADRLVDGLRRLGIELEPRTRGGVVDRGQTFGRVAAWRVGREFRIVGRPVTWGKSRTVAVHLLIQPGGRGSRVRLEVDGWPELVDSLGGGVLDWYAGTFLPQVVRPFGPTSLGDWFTDRNARRPTGDRAIANYRDPTFHWPNFLLILDRIRLSPSDRLLEVACGGGAFLHRALESGCTARGIDHSPDMLRTARALNRDAIAAGRLEILEGEADHLPAPDGTYTCCVCTGALGFFPDAAASVREMYRALAPGGRLAVYSSSSKLRGTPATPEPLASRLQFFEPKELRALARDAGFTDVRIEATDEESYARKAGLPEDVVAFFHRLGGGGAHLLLARKPASRRSARRDRPPSGSSHRQTRSRTSRGSG